jgi:hypothetical protein
MTPLIKRAIKKQIGMINLFFRYQGRLINAMKSLMKYIVGKYEVRLTQFQDRDVHLSVEIQLIFK